MPTLWLGVASLLGAGIVWTLIDGRPGNPFAFLPMMIVALLVYFFARHIGAFLVDEVFDGGDHLVVRVNGEEYRVPLADIEEVKESALVKQPPRIELILRYPERFGRIISFVPTGYSVIPFAKSALFYELTERVRFAHGVHLDQQGRPVIR
ncbi:MAG TPA: hypothetical protein VJ691_00285 [Vicinamibacterales bacterium]|nr:hypothetical protein [Vicinamibacterales bacterium]